MKKLLTFALISLLFACKENKPDPENGIIGKWKLVSYCKPGGTITCNRVSVPDSKAVIVEFSKKGSFDESYQSTIPAEYAFLGCGGGTYAIENGGVRIRAICMSSSNGVLIKIKSLTDKQLVLMPFEDNDYVFERE